MSEMRNKVYHTRFLGQVTGTVLLRCDRNIEKETKGLSILFLFRCRLRRFLIHHILDKNTVTGTRIVYKYVGHGADQSSVL